MEAYDAGNDDKDDKDTDKGSSKADISVTSDEATKTVTVVDDRGECVVSDQEDISVLMTCIVLAYSWQGVRSGAAPGLTQGAH